MKIGWPQLLILNDEVDHSEWLDKWARINYPEGSQVVRLNQERGEESLLSVELVRELVGVAAGLGGSGGEESREPPIIYLLLHLENASAAAQNALLKVLEEPPAKLQLILSASDLTAVLPTIVSRCWVRRPDYSLGASPETEQVGERGRKKTGDLFLDQSVDQSIVPPLDQSADQSLPLTSALPPEMSEFTVGWWERRSEGEIISFLDSYLTTQVTAQKAQLSAAQEETKSSLERRVARRFLTTLTQHYLAQLAAAPLESPSPTDKNNQPPAPSVIITALQLFQAAFQQLQVNVSPRLVLENIFFSLKHP